MATRTSLPSVLTLPPGPLVSTQWLENALGHPSLVILDASWYLPQQGRDAGAEYLSQHVPGAQFFDLDASSDPATDLPHMLPTPEHFAKTMGALGVGSATTVVVYDGSGIQLSAPRLWWMLRVFGHEAVAVLDGGWQRWQAEGRATESGAPPLPEPSAFQAFFSGDSVRTMAEVADAVATGASQVADARAPGRFRGEVAEPRPGLRLGHIPGSSNCPFTDLVDSATGLYRPAAELRVMLEAAGLCLDQPVITTCGSGVTACSLALALEVAGAAEVAVYDGSWAEWGRETAGG